MFVNLFLYSSAITITKIIIDDENKNSIVFFSFLSFATFLNIFIPHDLLNEFYFPIPEITNEELDYNEI